PLPGSRDPRPPAGPDGRAGAPRARRPLRGAHVTGPGRPPATPKGCRSTRLAARGLGCVVAAAAALTVGLLSPARPAGVLAATHTCPLSQGYWATHPGAWPVGSLVLGTPTYGQSELLSLLATSTKGDASLILAVQLIAAKLNVANGSNPSSVAATVVDADALLRAFTGKLPYKVKTTSPTGQAMVADASRLESY